MVTVVLYLFLGHLRSAGIAVVMIPLSLLATFKGLRIRGIPANLLSLGAMDFGIIVDGAVIVVENVFRRLSEHSELRQRETIRTIILEATTEVGGPTFFSMLVDTPGGLRIPLKQAAHLSIKSGSMNISRESGLRVKAIGVFIRGRDMGSLVEEMQQRVQVNVSFPSGYFVTWGGEFENQQRAMARLRIIVPVSVFLIFVLLFNAFNSVKSALLIVVNVPFALIGGIVAPLLTGMHLSVSAAIGFIALFGQAVLNGVVMVSYFNQLCAAGESPFQAVVEGALVWLRTVLMTALLAMLGLLPMALSHGIGSEVQKPLAVVIIGGLISATALTLIVLPTLYLLFAGRQRPSDSSEHDEPITTVDTPSVGS